jgi:integrase
MNARQRKLGGTVAQAVESWLADPKLGPAARWKGGLEGGSARAFLWHLEAFKDSMGARKLTAITGANVEPFIMEPASVASRNRRLTALRMLFAWARRKGLVSLDPTAERTKEKGERERTRTATDDELRALVNGFVGTRLERAVKLLAYTGLRKDEVLGAEWAWFDADAKTLTIPPEAEKTGRGRGESRDVALSPQAVTLLTEQKAAALAEGLRAAPFVFATGRGHRPHPDALKPTLAELREAGTIPADLWIHDIRRTVATAMRKRLRVKPWVIDFDVLGHRKPKLLRIYQTEDSLAEAREALTAWADLLDSILAAKPAAKPVDSGRR